LAFFNRGSTLDRHRTLALLARSSTFLTLFSRGNVLGGRRTFALLARSNTFLGLVSWRSAHIGRSSTGGATILRAHGRARRIFARLALIVASKGLRWRNNLGWLDCADGLLYDGCAGDGLSGTVAAAAQIFGTHFDRTANIRSAGYDVWPHFDGAHRLTSGGRDDRRRNAWIYREASTV
jgi:hypothetical protein